MNKLKTIIHTTFFISLVLISCGSEKSEDSVQEASKAEMDEITISQRQFEVAGMKLGGLTIQEFNNMVSARGHIDVPPGGRAAVSTYFSGYVKDIDVLEGQKVKKGGLLFTLQNPEYLKVQESYIEVKEQLTYLKTDFERQQTLSTEQIASQKSFGKAQSDYKVMLARYQALKEQLSLMNISISRLEQGNLTSIISIYAPIDGYISKLNTTKGDYINSSEVALEIVNTEHIHLELQVFEKDAKQVKEHQKIIFSVPESDNEMYEGVVHLVGKSVDEHRRTITVHGHLLREQEQHYLPGMYVEAKIVVTTQRVKCLPINAIVEKDGHDYVLVQKMEIENELIFEPYQIQVLRTSNGWVELSDTVRFTNKTILTEGAFSLLGS